MKPERTWDDDSSAVLPFCRSAVLPFCRSALRLCLDCDKAISRLFQSLTWDAVCPFCGCTVFFVLLLSCEKNRRLNLNPSSRRMFVPEADCIPMYGYLLLRNDSEACSPIWNRWEWAQLRKSIWNVSDTCLISAALYSVIEGVYPWKSLKKYAKSADLRTPLLFPMARIMIVMPWGHEVAADMIMADVYR